VSQEIRIPDIGDAESVEVVEILVAPGDTVGPDDPIIVIESDKASMEVPAGIAGTIESITVAVGDQVAEGQVIAILASATASAKTAQEPAHAATAASDAGRADSATAPGEAAQKRPARAEADRSEAEESARSARGAAAPGSAPRPAATAASSTTAHEVRVPDIGEADHVVVIEIGAKVGAEVAADDLLVVIESDKASMEIPVGVAGRILSIHVAEGDEVAEGALLATVEVAGGTQTDGAAAGRVAAPPAAATAQEPDAARQESAQAGAGAASTGAPASLARAEAAVLRAAAEATIGGPGPGGEPGSAEPAAQVYAGPAVRRLARELGVALEQVSGSGQRGRIVKEDVKAFVKARLAAPPAAAAGGSVLPALPRIDFSRFGEIETVPLSRIRARGADNLHRSWLNVPHVTQHDEVDITDLERFRKSLKSEAEAQGVKLTPIAFLIRACCQVLAEFPTMNSSLDADARNYIIKRYYNIGIAVDTEDGLVVPVIREADRKGVLQLAREVAELSDKARNRKLTPADHQGGTFSITSLGSLGGTGFTPIINAPEVAILGVGRLAIKPQWNGAEFVPRDMLPLSLSYDHRAINGAEAARFVARLAQLLGDIRRLLL
jgi:pyruvate dehydrogenase E2 component (dihydrolipoamide acetyltransferase)